MDDETFYRNRCPRSDLIFGQCACYVCRPVSTTWRLGDDEQFAGVPAELGQRRARRPVCPGCSIEIAADDVSTVITDGLKVHRECVKEDTAA